MVGKFADWNFIQPSHFSFLAVTTHNSFAMTLTGYQNALRLFGKSVERKSVIKPLR